MIAVSLAAGWKFMIMHATLNLNIIPKVEKNLFHVLIYNGF